MISFSNLDRAQLISQITSQSFDVLIVGGGITGAGIALDAATRGLKVALVEQNDFASGTSSKSTKLIHGGLRYLKQFDFWLVKEVGTERAVVHQLAPHLVVPEKMLLPIVKNGTYGSWLTSFGLKLYDILADVEGNDKRKMLSKAEALQLEPLLPNHILEGAGYYAEYRTDDARLTIEVLKTAINYSALALNYAKLASFTSENGIINGALIKDQNSGKNLTVNAKYIINATGPWVDKLRTNNQPELQLKKRLHLTKGVHIVVPYAKLPVKQSIYFDVPDGRMIFAIPRGESTYIGTTDTNYQSQPEEVKVNQVDALYLVSAVNNMFPDIQLDLSDIVSAWAGLRPLIHEEGKSPSELSRKDEIFEANNGLISIAGGKLTGYRKMAERVVDVIIKKIEHQKDLHFKPVKTEHITLCGGEFANYQAVLSYQNQVENQLEQLQLNKNDAKRLVHQYGRNCELILAHLKTIDLSSSEWALIQAELWYGITYEMVYTPSDFLLRRTSKILFETHQVHQFKTKIITYMASCFNWDESTKTKMTEQLEKDIKEATSFEP